MPAALDGLVLGGAAEVSRIASAQPDLIARLQRSAGNAAVARLLRQVAPPAAPAGRGTTADDDAAGGAALVADDQEPAVEQMRQGEFLDLVEEAVCTVADQELTGLYRLAGCPWIEHWIGYYRQREPAEVVAAIQRYAPGVQGGPRQWVERVAARVRDGIREWQETGEVPPMPDSGAGVPPGEPPPEQAAAAAAGAPAGVARMPSPDAAAGRHTVGALAVLRELGEGQPLDAGVRGRMEPLLGGGLADVRVHADPAGGAVARRLDAHALAIGRHVAFAPGRYEPGTVMGDALIAHELAHVVQQGDGSGPVADERAAEGDATTSAAGTVAALHGRGRELGRLAIARTVPSIRSGLALQRCPGEREAPDPRIWVPAPTRAVPGADVPGTRPGITGGNGGADVTFDGDGDQSKELLARLIWSEMWPDGALKTLRLDLGQLSSGTVRTADFQLPDGAHDGGPPQIEVTTVSDGYDPTHISLVAAPGSQYLSVHPPRRTAQDVTYDVELNASVLQSSSNRIPLTFPPETTPVRDIFSPRARESADGAPAPPSGARRVGNIWVLDVDIGAYGDPFRLTFRKPDPNSPATVFGISVLSEGQPVAGSRADLAVQGDLSVAEVASDPTRLALDLNGDGRADLTLHDRLTEPPGGGPLERNRDHRILLEGPAVTVPRGFNYEVRDGQIAAGTRPGTPEREEAASQARAVTGLEQQAGLSTVEDELEQIDRFLIRMRVAARDEELISRRLYGAWEALSMHWILLGPLMARNQVTQEQKSSLARDAIAFHAALAEDTAEGERSQGPADPDDLGERFDNPYTGGTSIRAGSMRIHEAPVVWIGDINDGRWDRASSRYRRLVDGLDRWIAQRYREQYPFPDASRPETQRAAAIEHMAGQRRGLATIEGRGRTRVQAVLHVTEQYERSGQISEVPLSMYYWKDGNEWHLQDFSRVDEQPTWSHEAVAGQTEPPHALFQHLDDNAHFPAGIVHYVLPSGAGNQVRTTGPSTLRQVLTGAAIAAAIVGTALATRNPGAVQVVGMRLLAASSLIGAGMAVEELIDRAQHGTLTPGAVLLNLTDIVGAATGLGALRAGRILAGVRMSAAATQATQATRAVQWANRWFLPLNRANQANDLVTLAVLAHNLEEQFAALQQMPNGEDKERALRSFFLQAAMTGGISALQIRGAIPEVRPGRNISIETVNGIEFAVPEGTSVQGRAINESRAELGSGAVEDAARQRHVEGIRTRIGGTGGAALAEIEELALLAARGDLTIDASGAMTRSGRAAGTLQEFVQRLIRANAEAAAHGVDTQYSMRIEPPDASGRSPVRITSEPRGRADPAGVMQTFLAGTTGRSQSVAQMVERLALADRGSAIEVLPAGQLRINGQIEIDVALLGQVATADPDNIRRLLVGTRLLAAEPGGITAFRTSHPTEAAWLDGFAESGSFRLRFTYHAQLAETMGRTGLGLTGDEATQMNTLITQADQGARIRLYDLDNERPRGGDNSWRTLYAQCALAQNPRDLREFINHYQFAKADIDRRFIELERLAAERLAEGTRAGRTMPRRGGATRPFNLDDARAELRGELAGDLGLSPVPADFDAIVRAEYGSPEGRRRLGETERQALQNVRGRTGAVLLAPGAAPVEEPPVVVERIRQLGQVPFGEQTTAAYHVHKHHAELPPNERFTAGSAPAGVGNEHEAILESARLTIAHQSPADVRSMPSQDGNGRRFFFERRVPPEEHGEAGFEYRMRAIVLVTFDGQVRLLTYGGSRTRLRAAAPAGAAGGGGGRR